MCKFPIKFPSFGIERTELQWTVADSCRGHYLGIVSSRENLVCRLELAVGHRFLDYCYSAVAQQTNHALASDAGKKGPVRDRRKHYTILRYEDVRGGQFGHVAQHVADDRIVKAPAVGLEKRASIVGIQATSFGVDWHRVLSRPAIGRKSDGEAFGLAHRSFVDRKAPPRGLWVMGLDPGPLLFRPIHRPDVQRRIPVESLYSFVRKLHPGFG